MYCKIILYRLWVLIRCFSLVKMYMFNKYGPSPQKIFCLDLNLDLDLNL